MNHTTYIWCPDCARLTPAKVVRGKFGSMKMRCGACDTIVKQTRAHAAKRCPDCGSAIHAPLKLLPLIPCPCKAPAPQAYAFCEACGQTVPVNVSETLLGQRGVCRCCGAKMTLDTEKIAVCPDCGSTLYGQEPDPGKLFCPCREPDFMEDAEPFRDAVAPAAAPPAADNGLRCACGGLLEPAGDAHICPVCRRTYSADEIRTMTYLSRHSHTAAPITIAWDTLSEPDHIIYVHPHSGSVPPKSLMIVEENQQAIYRTAGRYTVAQPGHYPIFTDTRSERERLEAAYTEITGDGILLQLDTRIIFFDSRYHEQHYRGSAVPLPDVQAEFLPAATYELKIDDPAALMTHALDLGGRDNELALLNVCRDWTARAITCAVSSRIQSHFGDMFTPGDGDILLQTEACLRRALPQEDCEIEINRMLSAQGRGLRIRNLIFDWECCLRPHDAPPAPKQTACPNCSEAIPDTGKSQPCPHCGQKALWCPTCEGYRRFDPRRVCTSCGRKLYTET